MKRDLDLARDILRCIEEAPVTQGWIDLEIRGRSYEEVSYHVMLLAKEGFIEAIDLSTHDGFVWKPKSLLWPGHDFLEASRDEGIWAKAKQIVRTKSGGLTFEVLKAVLVELVKGRVFS